METLKESVVIITGGSSGIGRATAFSFASKGARVLITGRRAATLAEAAKDHPNIETLVADTANAEDGSRTIARAIELWGRLDVLVNKRVRARSCRWRTLHSNGSPTSLR